MFARVRGLAYRVLLMVTPFMFAAPAMATPQFVPTGTESAHTPGSGQPGIEFDTSGLLSGGDISYDSGTGILTMTGIVDKLNYYDATNASCLTDVGSNCQLNYGLLPGGNDLDMTVQAKFVNITLTPLFSTFVTVDVFFETTGGAYDLIVTDPDDGGSVMLKGSFSAGEFGGDVTTGLQTQLIFDTATQTVTTGTANGIGFLSVDGSTLHSSLFDDGSLGPDFFGLSLTQVEGFAGAGGGLSEIIAFAINNGLQLPDFTAEADGQGFALAAGDFTPPIPEPSTAMLLGLGLVMMAAARNLHQK